MTHRTNGQNNWAYRSGYQRQMRVHGPIQPMARPSLWARLTGRNT